MVSDELLSYFVQLEGRNTCLDMFSQFRKGSADEAVGLAHQVYFIFRLQKNLHSL